VLSCRQINDRDLFQALMMGVALLAASEEVVNGRDKR